MRNGCRLAAILLLGALAAAGVHAQSQPRSMYVSVLDDKGAPVPDLGPSDFVVREDNMAREVLQVARATDPIQIALLVDTSQASREFILDYRRAIPAFLDVVQGGPDGPRNQVAIIGVGERPTILSDYTTSRTQLMAAVNRLFAITEAGTYLLDGIIETSQGLKKREATRSVIVAITSEGPELSDRHYQTVLEPLRASNATLHVIALGRPVNMAEDRSIALSRGTSDTGGRYDNLLVPSALPMRLSELGGEITGQYKVTYSRPETLIPPEKITIASNRPKVTTRGIPVNEPRPQPKRDRQE